MNFFFPLPAGQKPAAVRVKPKLMPPGAKPAAPKK